MGLYSLATPTRPLYSFRWFGGFAAVAYPLPAKHGDTLRCYVRFTHIGPAETVQIRWAPYVNGVYEWSAWKSVSLAEDPEPGREYTVTLNPVTYDSRGLGHCRRIDTNLELKDSTGKVWKQADTERFHNVVEARAYKNVYTQYSSPGYLGYEQPTGDFHT
ncbi:MAG: hypothetical protein DRI26_02860 [Chloroflexi bacterium]|nr:MAG: hypothetical protein DRI26_02860 [Chloroflexota bacterium]